LPGTWPICIDLVNICGSNLASVGAHSLRTRGLIPSVPHALLSLSSRSSFSTLLGLKWSISTRQLGTMGARVGLLSELNEAKNWSLRMLITIVFYKDQYDCNMIELSTWLKVKRKNCNLI